MGRRGPKKGAVYQKTLDKVAAREALRAIVIRDMDKLVRAQLQNALGLSHLFMRDETGKFVQITDPKMIETVLNAGEEGKYFYIHTKDPSIQAFTDLMNRALDKPAEQEQQHTLSGKLELVVKKPW